MLSISKLFEMLDSWKVGGVVGSFFALVAHYFSLLPLAVQLLPVLILFDTLTGIRASQVEKTFELHKMVNLFFNKVLSYVILVGLSCILGIIITGEYIQLAQLAGGILVFKETISTIENLVRIGVLKEEEVSFLKDFLRKEK